MKALPLLFLLPAACVAVADPEGQGVPPTQLTLDPGLYAEALREVQGLPSAPAATAPESAPIQAPVAPPVDKTSPAAQHAEVADWQAAMRDAGTELADVRLLALLQRLNPLDPPAARAEDYAAALRLHHLMLAGNTRAARELAHAFRTGCFESGLVFICSEGLAAVLERRAAAFQLPASPPLSPQQPAAPAGGAGEK